MKYSLCIVLFVIGLTTAGAGPVPGSTDYHSVPGCAAPARPGGGDPPIELNVTLMPQFMYMTYYNALALRDTFYVYLADGASPYALVDSAIMILDSCTYTGTAAFTHAENGSYFLVVKHRNSIETWSATGIPLRRGAAANYDFTDSQSKAYGGNLVFMNGKWCTYGGDVNQDGIVDFSDLVAIDNDAFWYCPCFYCTTDLNGDWFADFSDLIDADNNSYNFIMTLRPSVIVTQPIPERHGCNTK